MNWNEYFSYDPTTGNLIWKERPREHFKTDRGYKTFNSSYAGSVAGNITPKGYIKVGVAGVLYKCHSIVWEMFNGPVPEGMVIDHINGVKYDNRRENLRPATVAQNAFNRKRYSNNRFGLKGVQPAKNRWQAHIRVRGKLTNLGSYITKGLAAVAYAKAAMRYHGQFARFT